MTSDIRLTCFQIAKGATNFLSLIGCLYIMFRTFQARKYMKTGLLLIFLLSLFDMIAAARDIYSILTESNSKTFDTCYIEGFTKTFSNWMSLFLNASISLFAFFVLGSLGNRNLVKIFSYIILISLAVSTGIALMYFVFL